MAANSYVGKYGDALRRLQALEAATSGAPVGPMGPQPVTSPFQLESRLDPRFEPAPQQMAAGQGALAQGSTPGPAMTPGALGMPAPSIMSDDPAQGGISGNLPPKKGAQSVRQVVDGLSPDERRELRTGIKQQTGRTVNELYDEFVKSGEIAPPAERKPKAKERLTAVTEAMFRYLSLAGQGMSVPGAVAQATLETQGRRGALEQSEIEEENARAEARRGEVQGVLSARAGRQAALSDKEAERKHAMDLQAQQDKAALERTKISAGASKSEASRAPVRVVAEDGTVMERGPDGVWTPAQTLEEVDVNYSRGKKGKEKRPGVLRTTPRSTTGQVTAASRQKMMNDAIKSIQEDTIQMSRIRAAVGDDPEAIASEVANRAQLIVEQSLAAAEGLDDQYGNSPLD